jgi:ABC-2 type transport system permease protein
MLLPLYFVSGVFIPEDEISNGMVAFADLFPVRHFFDAFLDAYVPVGGPAVSWDNLAVVAAWGIAGLLLAVKFFRWTPRSG